jgi:hypothetical protein
MFDKGDVAKLEHRRSLANAVITFNVKKRSRDFRAAYQKEVHANLVLLTGWQRFRQNTENEHSKPGSFAP